MGKSGWLSFEDLQKRLKQMGTSITKQDADRLVQIGLVETRELDGKTFYKITPKGASL